MIAYAGISNPLNKGKYSVIVPRRIRPASRSGGWHLKAALGKHLYEDAEAAGAVRRRILELRTSPALLNKDPNVTLSLLFEELIHAESDMELLVGVYRVLKPALLEVYQHHMAHTQQLVDYPTIRMLKALSADLHEQIEWGASMIEALRQEGEYLEEASEFESRICDYLEAAGGIAGEDGASTSVPNPLAVRHKV